MKKFYQGTYKIKNHQKYLGDVNKCIFRSSWERKLMIYFDNESSIIKWGSEPFAIQYISPIDNLPHRYFVDFIIVKNNKDGNQIVTLIEVKPLKETIPPEKKKGKKKATYLYEVKTFLVNTAKWKAAKEFCTKKGWNFTIATEKTIFNNLQ